jgi:hypothetical protein
VTNISRVRRVGALDQILKSLARALPFVRPKLQSSATATSVGRPTTLILLRPHESLLNLGEDLVEPLLGAIRSLLIVSYVRLELRDPVFSRTKFVREPLSKIEGVLTIRLGDAGRLMQQTQNTATGAVQFVALIRRRGFRGRGKLDHRLTRIAHWIRHDSTGYPC